MRPALAFLFFLLAGGCGEKPADDAALNVEEAAALNDAEAMLDALPEANAQDAD